MAFLRLSDGRCYGAIKDINRFIAPMEIGKFRFDDELRERVRNMSQPISRSDAEFLVKSMDPEQLKRLKDRGFICWRVGNVVDEGEGNFGSYSHFQDGQSVASKRSAAEMATYRTPHTSKIDDIHFVFSGAIIKGAELKDGLQGVVYCQASDWIRIGPDVLNWPIFPSGEATVGLSYFNTIISSTKGVQMNARPDFPVLPSMLF